MNQTTYKIAVIGTGFGQKVHIPAYQYHHRTEVIALWNQDLGKAQKIAKAHNIPYSFDRLESLLALPDLDGVSLATPPFLHYEMAKQVLEAGKHLLLEKPMTLKAEEAKELYHLAQAKNLIVVADFEFRFVPAWQLLADYLQAGFVGNKRLIKVDWLVVSRADANRPWNWYSRQDLGGGALGSIGSHTFDYLHWLFGPIERLSGSLNCAIPNRPDPQAGGKLKRVDSDDTCLIMAELTDGTPCQIALSSVTYNGRGHWLEVYGDRGTLVLGSSNLKDYIYDFNLWSATPEQPLTQVEIPSHLAFPQQFPDGRLAAFIRVVDHWVNCLDRGAITAPSLKEGVYTQLLMDQTQASHQAKNWVNIPDFETWLSSSS